MSSIEQTREEFMVSCKAEGTDEVTCTNRWEAAHQAPTTVEPAKTASGDVDLLREIEMLKAQIAVRDEQLTQAIGIAERANDSQKAQKQAEKLNIIPTIMRDSKYGKDELNTKSLAELQTIRTTLDKSMAKTFANVAADIEASKRKNKAWLTAGFFDSATKTWKGGN